MQVEVANQLTVHNAPPEFEKFCKTYMEMDNPAYQQAIRFSPYGVGKGIPKKLILWQKRGSEYILPFGAWRLVYQQFPDTGFVCEREIRYGNRMEGTTKRTTYFYGDNSIDLFDYQLDAVRELTMAKNGILVSPCGSGKTTTLLSVIHGIGAPALWLAHTKDLLDQPMSRAKSMFGCPVSMFGTITDGKVNASGGLTFATVQTLSKMDLSEWRDYWDVIVVDESQHVASSYNRVTQFGKVMNSLFATYKYGCTATHKRQDGMHWATERIIGPVVYTVPDSAVASKKATVEVEIHKVRNSIGFEGISRFDGTLDSAKFMSKVCGDEARNKDIAKVIKDLI